MSRKYNNEIDAKLRRYSMGDDDSGFLHAIHQNPTDHTPRLVYADWLQERGEKPHTEALLRDTRVPLRVRDGEVVPDHPTARLVNGNWLWMEANGDKHPEGWINGKIHVVGGPSFNLGGGWVSGQGDDEYEDHPKGYRIPASYSDFTPYSGYEQGDCREKLADHLGLSDGDDDGYANRGELEELIADMSQDAWVHYHADYPEHAIREANHRLETSPHDRRSVLHDLRKVRPHDYPDAMHSELNLRDLATVDNDVADAVLEALERNRRAKWWTADEFHNALQEVTEHWTPEEREPFENVIRGRE